MTTYEQVVAEAAAQREAHGGNPRWWLQGNPDEHLARGILALHRRRRAACKCEKCQLARSVLTRRPK